MIKAVIFDLDDTLISEKDYIISGYHHIAKVLSSRVVIAEEKIFMELMDLFHQSPKNVFNRFYEKHRIDYSEKMIIDLVNEYRGHLPEIGFYDDVLSCLHEFKRRGIKTGIITDGFSASQRQKLYVVKAHKYFDEIIVTDELGREYWKPHPKAFEVIKEKFEVTFEEMIYVGDNPKKDFYISKIYPIKTVRIHRHSSGYQVVYKHHKYFKGIKENYKITSLVELYGLVTSL